MKIAEKKTARGMLGRNFILLPPSQGVDNNWHITDQEDTMVAHCYGFCHDIDSGEKLARRIVACLNACKEIDDSELSLGITAISHSHEIDRL